MKIRTSLSTSIGCLALLGFHFAAPPVDAANPEQIHLIRNGVLMSHEWYTEQAQLWQQEVDSEPQEPAAWRNYFLASHYAFHGQPDSPEKDQTLRGIYDGMSRAVPDSWEYLYVTLRVRAFQLDTEELRAMLVKALTLGIRNEVACADLFLELAGEFELRDDDSDESMLLWAMAYRTGELASGLIEYNYNLLMSTDQNAILFTNGDNDTYPSWMLQRAKEIRPDVLVLNRWLIRKFPSYLQRKLNERGIEIEVDGLPADVADYLPALCEAIAAVKPEIPVYVALTIPGKFKKSMSDRLYVTGLASRYSENRLDNLALLKRNVGRRFRLDHLVYDWNSGRNAVSLPEVYRLNTNYAVPFVMLFEHYTAGEELEKAARWKNLSLEVARKTEFGAELEERINR